MRNLSHENVLAERNEIETGFANVISWTGDHPPSRYFADHRSFRNSSIRPDVEPAKRKCRRTPMAEDRTAQEAVEHTEKRVKTTGNPPAGPHAKEHLIDREKTPGTGSLPEPDAKEVDAGSE
jgi:hypothetical protein